MSVNWNLFPNLPGDLSAKRGAIGQRATSGLTSYFGCNWGHRNKARPVLPRSTSIATGDITLQNMPSLSIVVEWENAKNSDFHRSEPPR